MVGLAAVKLSAALPAPARYGVLAADHRIRTTARLPRAVANGHGRVVEENASSFADLAIAARPNLEMVLRVGTDVASAAVYDGVPSVFFHGVFLGILARRICYRSI